MFNNSIKNKEFERLHVGNSINQQNSFYAFNMRTFAAISFLFFQMNYFIYLFLYISSFIHFMKDSTYFENPGTIWTLVIILNSHIRFYISFQVQDFATTCGLINDFNSDLLMKYVFMQYFIQCCFNFISSPHSNKYDSRNEIKTWQN